MLGQIANVWSFAYLLPLFNFHNTLRQASFPVQTRAQSETKMNIQINTIKYSKNTVAEMISLEDREVVVNDLKWVNRDEWI